MFLRPRTSSVTAAPTLIISLLAKILRNDLGMPPINLTFEQESSLLAGKLQQRDPIMWLIRRETRSGLSVKTYNLLPLEVTDSLEKFKSLIINNLDFTRKARRLQPFYIFRTNADLVRHRNNKCLEPRPRRCRERGRDKTVNERQDGHLRIKESTIAMSSLAEG